MEINKKTWSEFRDTGLFWWMNMLLHTFGWAIVISTNEEGVETVYPARTNARGFSEESNGRGYTKVANYMAANGEDIKKECE